jgi:hypothetical protein
MENQVKKIEKRLTDILELIPFSNVDNDPRSMFRVEWDFRE